MTARQWLRRNWLTLGLFTLMTATAAESLYVQFYFKRVCQWLPR